MLFGTKQHGTVEMKKIHWGSGAYPTPSSEEQETAKQDRALFFISDYITESVHCPLVPMTWYKFTWGAQAIT